MNAGQVTSKLHIIELGGQPGLPFPPFPYPQYQSFSVLSMHENLCGSWDGKLLVVFLLIVIGVPASMLKSDCFLGKHASYALKNT